MNKKISLEDLYVIVAVEVNVANGLDQLSSANIIAKKELISNPSIKAIKHVGYRDVITNSVYLDVREYNTNAYYGSAYAIPVSTIHDYLTSEDFDKGFLSMERVKTMFYEMNDIAVSQKAIVKTAKK